jgi:hypothetical protein
MLAQGLAALQSPGVPPQLMDVAEPIAQAMSALHRIEATRGAAVPETGPAALDAVRRALAMLQGSSGAHPAVDQAMEAVAGSLGLVHGLGAVQPMAPVPAAVGQAFGGTVVMDHGGPTSTGPTTQPSVGGYAAGAGAPPHVYVQQPAQPAYGAQPGYPAPQPGWGAPPPPEQPAWPQAQPQQQAWQQPQPQQAWQQPPAQPQQAWQQPPAQPQQAWQQPQPEAQQAWQQAPAPPRGGGAPAQRVEAELGAHSATNFYKGLSGNDVIDSGGIFIATYQIPPIGQDLIIKVSLPGGYEFEAMGVVKWTRDAPNSGADAPPGFGAQFTQISPEGRQLVYRYVRNREPLFHDDF